MDEALQSESYTPFTEAFLSVSRRGLVACGYSLFLKEYMEDETIIRGGRDLWCQTRRVYRVSNVGPRQKIRNGLQLVAEDNEEGWVHYVSKLALLFRLSTQTDRNETMYNILRR